MLNFLLQISENDALPKQLCQQCIDDITNCHKFIDKYHRSEQTLIVVLNEKEKTTLDAIKPEVLKVNDLELGSETFHSLSCWDHRYTNLIKYDIDYNELKQVETPGSSFPEKKEISEFITRHSYRCSYCSKTFTDLTSLGFHSCVDTGTKKLKCYECQELFKSMKGLRSHVLEKHLFKKRYHCDVCDKDFGSKNMLRVHQMVHVERIEYKQQVHELSLDVIVKDAPRKPHVCNICEEGFGSKYMLQIHEMIHIKKETKNMKQVQETKCMRNKSYINMKHNYCNKRFDSMLALGRHSCINLDKVHYRCNKCRAHFNKWEWFNLHITENRCVPEKQQVHKTTCTTGSTLQFVRKYEHIVPSKKSPVNVISGRKVLSERLHLIHSGKKT